MDEQSRKLVEELHARVAELERQLIEDAAIDTDTFATDFFTEVERRIFRMLIIHLDALTPGLTAMLRRNVIELETKLLDAHREAHPKIGPVNEWMRVRAMEIIDEMLPAQEDEPSPV
ncbi:hypothetical protein [Neorhizobium petrolearium]|uniref:hypothetical protein n=1 Tax=Neorhizobium petrolearium TaxID=515361 RepID=UPI003F7DCC82